MNRLSTEEKKWLNPTPSSVKDRMIDATKDAIGAALQKEYDVASVHFGTAKAMCDWLVRRKASVTPEGTQHTQGPWRAETWDRSN